MTSPSNNRVICVGIDGAPHGWLSRWMLDGKLPNLKKITDSGAFGSLKSTVPPLTAPAWAAFLTGLSPANTGIFEFVRRDPASYDLRPVNSRSISGFALWDYMDSAALSSCFINVPMTFPAPQKERCAFVTGMLTPKKSSPSFTFPADLFESCGFDKQKYEITVLPKFCRDDKELVEKLLNMASTRSRLAEQMLDKQSWDFFMVHFYATDVAQHVFWRTIDSASPIYEDTFTNAENPVLKVYRVVDTFLEKVIDKMEDGDILIVCSDHGFGASQRHFHINRWLEERGWLSAPITLDKLTKMFSANLIDKYRRSYNARSREIKRSAAYSLIPDFIRKSVDEACVRFLKTLPKSLLLDERLRLWSCYDWIDWDKTSVYTIGSCGGLYINLQGREPAGTVPRSEYDAFRQTIIDDIKALRDDTGRPVVENALPREQVYRGKFAHLAPDIVLFAEEHLTFFNPARSEEMLKPPDPYRSGDHTTNGIFAAFGKNIKNGCAVSGARIIDMAPTILSVLGIGPTQMDGRVLDEVFVDTGFLAQRREVRTPHESEVSSSTQGDENEIMDTLKGLGYLD